MSPSTWATNGTPVKDGLLPCAWVAWSLARADQRLAGRDAVVNNLGSLLDPGRTGAAVPE
jgi:hypothetical protein